MIVFDLKCRDGGETFEGWFRSSTEYDEQAKAGLIQCPFCQSSSVEKAPMAPMVPRKGAAEIDAKAALAALSAMQQRLLTGSTFVGDSFPEQARAMHLGEIETKPVHGQASPDEARSLAEDGVPILPLPLPVTSPGQLN